MLLSHNADPNIQDYYGNTALHYCIIDNNMHIFLLLMKSKYTKNKINVNLFNIDSEEYKDIKYLNLNINFNNNDIVNSISNYKFVPFYKYKKVVPLYYLYVIFRHHNQQ